MKKRLFQLFGTTLAIVLLMSAAIPFSALAGRQADGAAPDTWAEDPMESPAESTAPSEEMPAPSEEDAPPTQDGNGEAQAPTGGADAIGGEGDPTAPLGEPLASTVEGVKATIETLLGGGAAGTGFGPFRDDASPITVNPIFSGDLRITGTVDLDDPSIPAGTPLRISATTPSGVIISTVSATDGSFMLGLPSSPALTANYVIVFTVLNGNGEPLGIPALSVTVQARNPSATPTLNPIYIEKKSDSDFLSGTGEDGATISVYHNSQTATPVTTTVSGGVWSADKSLFPANWSPALGDVFYITQMEASKEASPFVSRTVESNVSAVPTVNPIYEGDRYITGKGVPGARVGVEYPAGIIHYGAAVGTDGSWSVPVSRLGSSIYTDSVIKFIQYENGKDESAEVSVTALALPTVTVDVGGYIMVDDVNGVTEEGKVTLTATVTGGAAPYRYSWKHEGSTVTDDTPAIKVAETGLWEVYVTDANGIQALLAGTAQVEAFAGQVKLTDITFGHNRDKTLDEITLREGGTYQSEFPLQYIGSIPQEELGITAYFCAGGQEKELSSMPVLNIAPAINTFEVTSMDDVTFSFIVRKGGLTQTLKTWGTKSVEEGYSIDASFPFLLEGGEVTLTVDDKGETLSNFIWHDGSTATSYAATDAGTHRAAFNDAYGTFKPTYKLDKLSDVIMTTGNGALRFNVGDTATGARPWLNMVTQLESGVTAELSPTGGATFIRLTDSNGNTVDVPQGVGFSSDRWSGATNLGYIIPVDAELGIWTAELCVTDGTVQECIAVDTFEVSASATLSPDAAIYDRYTNTDVSTTLNSGSYSFVEVKQGDTVLTEGTHYTVEGDEYLFDADYLESLALGEHPITFVMSGGTNPVFTLTVVDTSDDYNPKTLTFTGLPDVVYVGDTFTLTPSVDDNTGEAGWAYDNTVLKGSFNSPATFTALRAGETTVTYKTADGKYEGSLTITILAAKDGDGTKNPSPTAANSTATGTTPKTGDESNLIVWVLIIAVVVIGAICLLLYMKKRNKAEGEVEHGAPPKRKK